MANIFKISGYIVDPEETYTADYIRDTIQIDVCGSFMFDQHLHIEGRNIGDWNDELPINQENCDLYDCEKYFKGGDGWPVDIDREVVIGQKYKHFKGKIVEVVAISQDTEMPGQFIVVYKDKDRYLWHRPLGMFLSEVDHVKYPDVTQKYRFELITGDETNE